MLEVFVSLIWLVVWGWAISRNSDASELKCQDRTPTSSKAGTLPSLICSNNSTLETHNSNACTSNATKVINYNYYFGQRVLQLLPPNSTSSHLQLRYLDASFGVLHIRLQWKHQVELRGNLCWENDLVSSGTKKVTSVARMPWCRVALLVIAANQMQQEASISTISLL